MWASNPVPFHQDFDRPHFCLFGVNISEQVRKARLFDRNIAQEGIFGISNVSYSKILRTPWNYRKEQIRTFRFRHGNLTVGNFSTVVLRLHRQLRNTLVNDLGIEYSYESNERSSCRIVDCLTAWFDSPLSIANKNETKSENRKMYRHQAR